ncbi:GerMN domain-containing protein [Actinoplanes sp. NPDC048967]|uniref:GerMN domain-containing protein n=1 Tax=Actinoplanes sp. NPDC048967 TaxID=3155269 RepID=UPI0033FB09F3
MSRSRRLAVVMLATALLSSCGVSTQSEPHAVELPRRPLTEPHSNAASEGPTGDVAEVLCMVRDDRLVQTVRRLAAPPTAQEQIDHLLAGPTQAERERLMTTALAGLSVEVRVGDDATAQAEITEADEGSARTDETLAYAQIVCTLTSRADVASVFLSRDGDRLEVPRADGSLSRGPLYGSDYISLIAPA